MCDVRIIIHKPSNHLYTYVIAGNTQYSDVKLSRHIGELM